MEKKVLLVLAFLGTLLAFISRPSRVQEKIVRKERADNSTAGKHIPSDIYYFESGNRAVVTVEREQGHSERYVKYSPEGKTLEKGRFIDGFFDRDYDDRDYWWEKRLELTIFLWILVVIFWFKHLSDLNWRVIDTVRNAKAKPFDQLAKEEQDLLIRSANDCATCKSDPALKFVREENNSGMRFIYCSCSRCGEEKRLRIK